MKIPYSWLKDFVAIKESPEKLAELLSFSSFETIVDKKMGKDTVLEVSLLPNRVADAASHLGIAREIGLLTKRNVKFQPQAPKESKQAIQSFAQVQVITAKVRRYSLRALAGVKVKDSPVWLKKRLASCGLRPINNIVDATNYVMLELGQPLHAFDADEVKNKKIIVRQAKKGEKIETIERKNYVLTGTEILIADKVGPLGLAGIKGGRRGEISKKTRNVLIESANFDPITTRQTSKTHGIRTDASWRFENNLDPTLTKVAQDRVVALIQELAGGEILRGMLDFYPRKVLPWPIVIEAKKTSRLLGVELTPAKVTSLVKPFCERIERRQGGKLLLHIKTYRRDLRYPEDIAEEVARLIGYNAIPAKPSLAPLTPLAKNESLEFRELLTDHMISPGFSEVQNYSFISRRDAEALGFRIGEFPLIAIENPISQEYSYLRPDLFAGMLRNVRDNLRFYKEVRVFEIGKQYRWRRNIPDEEWKLAGAIARTSARPQELFFEVKGVLESLFERLGLDREDYDFRPLKGEKEYWYFVPGQHSGIYVGGKQLGKMGIIREAFTRAYDIDAPMTYWRLDIEPLQREVQEEHEFEPLHKYPDIIRDISMLVPIERKIDEIEQAIFSASSKYLEEVELFDIYEGEGMETGKKSLAFHLIFRAPNRTLTSKEVEKEISKITQALKNLGARIR